MLLGIKMSTSGPIETITPPASLSALITTGNEKAALSLIKKGTFNLREFDKLGMQAIHYAAIKGSMRVFKKLCEKGADPYAPDQNGFSPYYHAVIHKQNEVIEYYDKNYPLELEPTEDDNDNQKLNDFLKSCGLQSYMISPNDDAEGENYIIGLFKPAVTMTEAKPLKSTKSSKPDLKKQLATVINPILLTRIAYGIKEAFTPAEILKVLIAQLPNLEHKAKLASIYFIKELIRQDHNNEWIDNPDFSVKFIEFTDGLGTSLALTSLRIKLRAYYEKKLNKQTKYLENAFLLAADLSKMFGEAFLKLSPKSFLARNMLTNFEQNEAFLALSHLTNQLSHLVCLDILHATSAEQAAQRVVFYMDVMAFCLKENKPLANTEALPLNFAAAAAIYNGLQFNVIRRLDSISSQIPDAYKMVLQKYDELFNPSSKGLRAAMTEHPSCIPVTAVYSADKDKIAENKQLTARISLFGKLNELYDKHYRYIKSIIRQPNSTFMTDIASQLQKVTFKEEDAYWYSYQLQPARVINLDISENAGIIIGHLKLCRDVRSLLALKQSNIEHRGLNAKAVMESYLKGQTLIKPEEQALILELCDKVIEQFEKDTPAVEKEKAQKKLIRQNRKLTKAKGLGTESELLTQQLQALTLDSGLGDNIDRPRAQTKVDIRTGNTDSSEASFPRRRKVSFSSRRPEKNNLPFDLGATSSTFTPLASAKKSAANAATPSSPSTAAPEPLDSNFKPM